MLVFRGKITKLVSLFKYVWTFQAIDSVVPLYLFIYFTITELIASLILKDRKFQIVIKKIQL